MYFDYDKFVTDTGKNYLKVNDGGAEWDDTAKYWRAKDNVGGYVQLVNTFLYNAGLLRKDYITGGSEFFFSPGTEKAVKEFQKLTGLSVDGIVGRDTIVEINKTWELMKKAVASARAAQQDVPFSTAFTLVMSAREGFPDIFAKVKQAEEAAKGNLDLATGRTGLPATTYLSRDICVKEGYFWYNNTCNQYPETREAGLLARIPWLPILAIGGGILFIVIAITGRKRMALAEA